MGWAIFLCLLDEGNGLPKALVATNDQSRHKLCQLVSEQDQRGGYTRIADGFRMEAEKRSFTT